LLTASVALSASEKLWSARLKASDREGHRLRMRGSNSRPQPKNLRGQRGRLRTRCSEPRRCQVV